MPDQSNPAPAPAPAPAAALTQLPNPTIPPGLVFESNAERHARTHGAQPPTAPPLDPSNPDSVSAQLEQARYEDRQAAQRRMAGQEGQQPPAMPEGQQSSTQSTDSNLQFRPRAGRSGQQDRKTSANWEQLKQRNQQLEQELQRLRGGLPAQLNPDGTQASAAQQAASLSPEQVQQHELYKQLKQERDTFYEEVKHVRVEADPEFKAKFDSKREAALRIAKSVAGGAAEDIARIMNINDPDVRASQLAERIKDFSDGSKARIMAANAQLDVVSVEREMEIASRKATWEHTQAARAQQQQASMAQRMGQLDREFNDVVAKWNDPEHGFPLMLANPQRAIASARQIFSGETSGKGLAEAALKAAMFDDAIKLAHNAYEEVQRLQASLQRYGGGSTLPDFGGGYEGGSQTPVAPVSLSTVDRSFLGGLEAARQADLAKG